MPFWKQEKKSGIEAEAEPLSKCTNCGAVYYLRGARFCPQCGGKVEAPPAPVPSKPKKSEPEKKEYKTLTGDSVFMTDEEVADAIKKYNAGKNAGKLKKSKGISLKRTEKTEYGPKRTTEQNRQAFDAIGDAGLALSGPVGWFFLGRRQNKRKQDAQQQRVESLLREIRDKK